MTEIQQIELYVDGGSRGNPGPAACAFVLKHIDGPTVNARGFFLGQTTNNVAEYTGLIRGLEAARDMGVREIHVYCDSELVVRQIIGEYRVKSRDLFGLFEQVQRLLLGFDRWQIKHVPRALNAEADRLVNETLDAGSNGSKVPGAEDTAAESPAREPSDGAGKVLVEVVTGCAEACCPAAMRKGQCFVFSEVVPAGLCVHAALAMLPTVIALQDDPGSRGRNLMVRCNRPGCNAAFKLTLL